MVETGSDRRGRRIAVYLLLLVGLLAGAHFARVAAWHGTPELHTLQETLATAMALMAGAMALVRHHTKKTASFLLLGGGLTGAGLLDGYHALITSGVLPELVGQAGGVVAEWSGLSPRIYLSALVSASCLALESDDAPGRVSRRRDAVIYAVMAAGLVISFLSLRLAVHPPPHSAGLTPASLFAVGAVPLLGRGRWKTGRFPHWLMISVLMAALGDLAYMVFSTEPFDTLYLAGHAMKITAYGMVLIGLFLDMSAIFRREEDNATRLRAAIGLLEAEITERQQAEESLLRTQNELEVRVESRTADLMKANRSLEEEICERRWAESELCVQEERFRLAAQNASDVIWEWDIEADRISIWSDPADRLGQDKNAFPPTMADFVRMVHADDRPEVLRATRAFIDVGEDFRQEYRIVTPGGEVRHRSSRGTAIRDQQARPSRCVGVTSDITERKHAEEAFTHMAAIVESSEAAIVSKSLDGTILTWNAAAERIFGHRADEVKGKLTPVLPAELQREERDLLEKISRGECVQHMETVRMRKDGTPINVVLAVSPIRSASGRITGGSWVVWDTTERKLLERQLAQAQKLESIGQLAAGIAHEINTPIQYVGDNIRFFQSSFAQLEHLLGAVDRLLPALRKGEPPTGLAAEIEALSREADLNYLREEIPSSIAQSLEGVEHVSRIVGAMKEFSHPGPIGKRAVDLNRAIESTIQVSRNEWKYVASLDTELDRNLPLVPCIPGEFNQVVLNLIINAAHAIADRIKTRPDPPGKITVSTRRNGAWAEIRVRDTGTGIPEAVQAKIFDPFFTTKPVGQGTGQGLAIAHAAVVRKHGGTISFETESGAGTTFLVTLPLEQPA